MRQVNIRVSEGLYQGLREAWKKALVQSPGYISWAAFIRGRLEAALRGEGMGTGERGTAVVLPPKADPSPEAAAATVGVGGAGGGQGRKGRRRKKKGRRS